MNAPVADLLDALETYYDTAPRASATTEEVGPFTLFLRADELEPKPSARRRRLMREGRIVTVAAYDDDGRVVGGGSHGPWGGTTELAGIAVLPRMCRHGVGAALTHALVADAGARGLATVFLSAQDDSVARVYERVGFRRVGIACTGEA